MSVRPAFLNDGFVPAVFKQVGAAVTAAQKLPDADEQAFLQFSPEFQPAISALRSHAKSTLLKLLKFVNPQCTSASYDDVVDASDECLENVSFSLEEHSLDSAQNQLGRLAPQQLLKYEYPFLRSVDNSLLPFVPKIRRKPNARVPLDPALVEFQRNPAGVPYTKHPYQYEIEHLPLPEPMKRLTDPQPPQPLESTPFELVSTPAQFQSMLDKLKIVSELAIDLEHHSIRSYQGLVCLMQISTRGEDFIVDTLAVWEEMPKLLDVFTDPGILKVLHGADSDVLWLQRDFGLYLVNMFDTGQAARELKMTSFSLAFLLKRLCQTDTDKSYQLADWRVRPLSSSMTQYARIDTHYLLYIYDRLKLDLAHKGRDLHKDPDALIQAVFQRSKDVCLKVFEKPRYVYMGIKKTGSLGFGAKRAVEAVAEWRDKLARRLDESPSFILTGEAVVLIASTMPSTPEELLSRLRRPSPLLTHDRAAEVISVIAPYRDSAPVPSSTSVPAPILAHPPQPSHPADWLLISKLLAQAPNVKVKMASGGCRQSFFSLFERHVDKPQIKSAVQSICRNFESLFHPKVHCQPEDMELDSGPEVSIQETELATVQPSTADFIELKVPSPDTKPLPIKRKNRDKQAVRVVPDPPELLPASKLKIEMTDMKVEPKLTKRRKLLRK